MTKSEAARKLSLSRKPDQRKGGRPVVLVRCLKCKQILSARRKRKRCPKH